jgi:hypothetical protein
MGVTDPLTVMQIMLGILIGVGFVASMTLLFSPLVRREALEERAASPARCKAVLTAAHVDLAVVREGACLHYELPYARGLIKTAQIDTIWCEGPAVIEFDNGERIQPGRDWYEATPCQ